MSADRNEGSLADGSFNTKRWCRNVLDVMAASRKHDPASERWTFLCAAVAIDWMVFADKDGLLFRAAEDTAVAIGAAQSKVRDAGKRLEAAGLAERPEGLKKQTGKKTKGRDATTYRLKMVDVLRLYGGENLNPIASPIGEENGGGISTLMGEENAEAISAPMGAGFSAPIGAANRGRTLKGAGARANAPPAPPPNGGVSLGEEEGEIVLVEETDDSHAQGAAITSETDLLQTQTGDPSPAADTTTVSVPRNGEGTGSHSRPVTLEDLEKLAFEECEAEVAGDPFFDGLDEEPLPTGWTDPATAIFALHELWGEALPDADGYAVDLIDGFVAGDAVAQEFAVGLTMAIFVAAPQDSRFHKWPAHLGAVRALFGASGRGEQVAERATAAFEQALKTEKARRASAPPADPDDIEGEPEDQIEEISHG